jgi:hypothetical protein
MKYKFIERYSDFILNETLTSHNIDLTISNVEEELSLMRYDFSIKKDEKNRILLTLLNFSHIQLLDISLKHIDSLLIDRHGWFPSEMKITNILENVTIRPYDEKFLYEKIGIIKELTIYYESKYDLSKEIPEKLYHLSIQEYKDNILKKGLIPKFKSKLSKHLDRIYLSDNINSLYQLIPRMTADYMFKMKKNSKINIKWIIFEINTKGLNIKLYKDPNSSGVYCVDNISSDRIKIIDEEI